MKNKKLNTTKDNFSKWEKNIAKDRPLLSQLVLNIVAGSIAGIIAGSIVTWWAANTIPPKPQYKVIPSGQSSAFIVENLGYIPADIIYDIATPPTAVPNFSIDEGQEYIKLENTSDEHVKRAIIKGLPKSGKIEIIISGSKNITIHKK